jgi:hypothetical protein
VRAIGGIGASAATSHQEAQVAGRVATSTGASPQHRAHHSALEQRQAELGGPKASPERVRQQKHFS